MAIIWPCSRLVPRNISVDPASRTMAGPASVSGFTQVVASDAGLWKATYEEIPVRDAQGIGLVQLWRAIAVQAEGRLNPILICVHDIERKPFPIGLSDADLKGEVPHSDDALFDDGAGYVSSVIDVSLLSDATIRSTMLNVIKALSGDLEPGHRFSIGERLYQVRSVVAQDAVTATIKIWPPLREAWHAGSRLEFDRPVLRVRLASDKEMDLPLELGRWSFPTVNFIEDL
ncbi:hypothetical protein [Hoeflea sp. 108]|uniref:hypothetical protein n=1 Tax=Hoeflea sp. 108 TaxID=1116369 RepID=UPI00047826E2|nr:hypothetical protein [Hoeflea sp. 108]